MTEAELLAAIETALSTTESPEGAMTMQELMAASGANEKAMRTRLRALKNAGRLEVVRVGRENLAGYVTPVPAYRLVDAG